jgi:hypothetical protein
VASLKEIVIGVLSNAIFLFLCSAAGWLRTRFSSDSTRYSPASGRIVLISLFFLWIVLNMLILLKLPKLAPYTFVLTAIGVGSLLFSELDRFWKVGIVKADPTITQGLSYEKSLNLCANGLEFLGIGAGKLTTASTFEAAMRRCHRPDRPIRFLLARANSKTLEDAAKRKGLAPSAYGATVNKSLQILRELKIEKSLNIEVRMYSEKEDPVFRLMFINDSLCLVSYHVFGEGDGSQLPQLHLNRSSSVRDTQLFYRCFREYFEKLWDRSKEWDFNITPK